MKRNWRPTYSQLNVMLASPVRPMLAAKSRHQLTRMHEGLLAIETAQFSALAKAADALLKDWRSEW